MALEDLSKYIGRAEEQLKPALTRRIEKLAKKEREEQLWGAEKLQQMGKFTSGFRPGLMEKIIDIYTGYAEEARGESGREALSLAQFLYGLGQQAEEAEKERVLKATLTREGYALQRYLATLGGGAGGRGTIPGPVPGPAPGPGPGPIKDTSRSAYDKERADFERRIRKAAEGFAKYEERGMTKQPAYPIKGISPTYAPYRVDKSKPVYY